MTLSHCCEANTKKRGTQCENYDAVWCEAAQKILCHLHHPDRTFRQQLKAKQEHRRMNPRKLKPVIPPDRVRHPNIPGISCGRAPAERDTPTPMLDRPLMLDAGAGKAAPPPVSKTLFRGKP